MSRSSYSTGSVPSRHTARQLKGQRLPTFKNLLYSTVDQYEKILTEKPHLLGSLNGIISTLVADECRAIGF